MYALEPSELILSLQVLDDLVAVFVLANKAN